MSTPLQALRKVDFDWTAHIDEIWTDQPADTHQLQGAIRTELCERLEDLMDQERASSPLGIPMLGPAGAGKTHLLGALRREAKVRDAYFILADMTDVADFWETVTLGYLRSLQQVVSKNRRQVDLWLTRMIAQYGAQVRKASAIPQQRPPGLINRIEELIKAVRSQHRAEVQEHVDVLRALVLFACDAPDINDLGYKWLQGLVIDDDELKHYGFRQTSQTPSRIVRGISWLLSLTGVCVLALDQLDAIVAEHELAVGTGQDPQSASEQQRRSLAIIQGIAGGLMELRDVTRRTLTVVSSLEATWDILDGFAPVSMADRFEDKLLLRPAAGADIYRQLVIKRLGVAYTALGFEPAYPSYPYTDAFFERHRHSTPRELLKACEAHRKRCKRGRLVVETETAETPPDPVSSGDDSWKQAVREAVDARMAQMVPDEVLQDASESLQDGLVEAACEALVLENPVPNEVAAKVDKDFMGTGNYDPLHARIRLIYPGERERHHAFRFLQKAHYRAFQARLKAALTASGIEPELSFRGLTILRCANVPSGAATTKLVEELHARGGHLVSPSEQDLRLLLAIRTLHGAPDEPERFEEWLAAERPVSKLDCFNNAVHTLFGTPPDGQPAPSTAGAVHPEVTSSESPLNPAETGTAGASTRPQSQTTPEDGTSFKAASAASQPGGSESHAAQPRPAGGSLPDAPNGLADRSLPVGRYTRPPHDEATLDAAQLLNHVCVFAGSGSGKTVFLKRAIEEAALLGIPSIIVDGANDLTRLGSPWPSRPESFTDSDVDKAQRYHAGADVVVWTPGAPGGNPMQLNPLPDFAALQGQANVEERDAAIELATASIASLVVGKGGTGKKQEAILKGTLRYFAQQGGDIRELARLLREPPDDVIEPYEKGDKLAREMSELLHSIIATDPLLGGAGVPLEPGLLFRASDPERTRVSVLSLVGLSGQDQRRRFVDQLATTLFTWIKKHPAPSGGMLGLLVIDEAKDFVPATQSVPGKQALLRLAAQARKYGLGLLFATQEPKSIDNKIVSNCSTLLGGRMNSPATIEALQDLLASKGTPARDVAGLRRGEFYFGTGTQKPRKITTALCLSHHPSSPPSEAEVLQAASAGRKRLEQS